MEDEKEVKHDNAHITGRTEGPFGSDDTDVDRQLADNKNQFEQENSANGLDSEQIRGGQDGRNERGMGSIDMDSKNGVLRSGDITDSTMEVTEEGLNSAIADSPKTHTASVNLASEGPVLTTPSNKVIIPVAQDDLTDEEDEEENTDATGAPTQQEREDDVAETGTDLNNEPTY